MKTIKSILIAVAFISVALFTNELKAQNIYKTNADTVRLTVEFYLLAKTNGNITYYTLDISELKTEFENLYFKDFTSKDTRISFKTIAYNEGQEAIFEVDNKYSKQDVLYYFATAKKMTKTENYRFSDIEKQSFITKAKENK
ncbi:MAG: hypothetical protein WCL51_00255 [Bacteroidota bacterium]